MPRTRTEGGLTQRITVRPTAEVRHQAKRLVADDAVRLWLPTDDGFHAFVGEPETCSVVATVKGQRRWIAVNMACTCAKFKRRARICEHAWAVWLAMEGAEPDQAPGSVFKARWIELIPDRSLLEDVPEPPTADSVAAKSPPHPTGGDEMPAQAALTPAQAKILENAGIDPVLFTPRGIAAESLNAKDNGNGNGNGNAKAKGKDIGNAKAKAKGRGSQKKKAARGTDAPPKAPPRWMCTIESIGQSIRRNLHDPRSEPWPLDRQVLYCIQVDATLASSRGLVLELLVRQPKRNGSWSKPRCRRITMSDAAALPDPDDREIITLLEGVHQNEQHDVWPRYYRDLPTAQITLPPSVQSALMQRIARTGRCVMSQKGDYDALQPVPWLEGPPWQLALRFDEGDERRLLLRGELQRDDDRCDLSEPLLLTRGGLVLFEQGLATFDHVGAFDWVPPLRRDNELAIPEARADEVLEQLARMPRVPRLVLPERLGVSHERGRPQPRLRIARPRQQHPFFPVRSNELQVKLSFSYEGIELRWGDGTAGVYHHDGRRWLQRDRDAEDDHARRLRKLGFREPRQTGMDGGEHQFIIVQSNLARAIRTLLREGWHIEAEGKLHRPTGQLKLNVRGSGIDWFELEGEAQFDDQTVSLPKLLAAIRRGENFIQLDDGSFGLLPEQWLKRYGTLADIGQKGEDGNIQFQPTQIGLIDALLMQMPEVDFDSHVEKARQKLARFSGIRPRPQPRGFQGELRPYQRDGLGWMHFLHQLGFGGCLADDMGLGKTVQVLALLEKRRHQRRRDGGKTPPSLVVAPRSLIHNWQAEAARFTPELRVLDHTGSDRFAMNDNANGNGNGNGKAVAHRHDHGDDNSNGNIPLPVPGRNGHTLPTDDDTLAEAAAAVSHFADYDLILTTYATLRRDIVGLSQFGFDYVILDEAQAIKNADTISAQAARLLRAEHRLALSGTPIENHLGELVSLFEFLNPGMLGRANVWLGGTNGKNEADEATRELLAAAVRPFILRRTKRQVAPDLPDRTEQTLHCDLEDEQRRLYDELREHYRRSLLERVNAQGLNRNKIQVLEALLRLRQAACHPGLIDSARAEESSAKLDMLLPQLDEVLQEGHKALVFSQFTRFLAIVRKRLEGLGIRYAYLDGNTRNRAEVVEQFQTDPDCKLFLISLKAGGLGLNLTAAEYVFLLDPWWNPAVEAQAIDRAHRIGQQEHVFAYRLIARDTVEEKVLQLQQSKKDLADAIIRADSNLIRNLTVEDLHHLFS